MSKYQQFVFVDYSFDADAKTATFTYGYDDSLRLTETFRFDFDYASYNSQQLDTALQTLFFLAGTSYYKMYVAPEIVVQKGSITTDAAAFYNETYQKGLGEFWYLNKLDPRTPVNFPVAPSQPPTEEAPTAVDGLLIGIGGGKDSLVSVELLRGSGLDIATWSVGHRTQLKPLIERIGLQHFWVDRTWDPQIQQLNGQDALNGHIPISAIFAAVSSVVAILSGRRDVVVSNEQSANEPTLLYDGIEINHQYSKSQVFEQGFQKHLQQTLEGNVRYYSLLRPFSELRIAEMFAQVGFAKYNDVFSSCNRAFTHDSPGLFWDGTCSKCAFVFLALTPFVKRSQLEELFGDKNLLLDTELEQTYRQLLGIEGDKPLECVGEIKESRAAMREAFSQYPELAEKYQFNIPEDYDFRTVFSDELPAEIRQILLNAVTGRS